ncbi:MAG: hypothetical protein IH937_12600 [Acidobacteria bacterium]|nr:hypothetical protein [Acidobacteriota bacterium]
MRRKPASNLSRFIWQASKTVSLKDLVQQFEDEIIKWAMTEAGGEQQRAAQLLGLPRTTLQSKLTKGN